MTIPPDHEVVLRLVTAVLCGGFIGLERDLRRMPTGFRTMAIVSLGACVAAIAGVRHGDTDGFSRIAQGVVTGIGFLGAGVILQHNNIHHVKGLTTAAAIWLTAAIGLMCGIGELKLAIVATALAIAVLLLDYFGSRLWPKLPKSESVEDEFTPRDGD
ncbi:MgtC/SapB family protein [Hyphomicrobium sp.]|jgi:putative Mg2+ transporter-C (MgtC) family protein|uniref:MgtC/SapB family protein n=1 Tax=Hyphomicrobium sp. TaxID=82 RepID=UPI0035616978